MKTKTGKKIYANTTAFDKKYLRFSIKDHSDAAEFHNKKAFDLRGTSRYSRQIELEKEHLLFCK
jgi:hypothetical protein